MSDDPMERIARERYQEWLTHPCQCPENPTWDELDVNTRNDWREDAVDILPRLRSGDRVGPDGSLVVVPALRAEAAEARIKVLTEALRMYALPEHWMSLTESGPAINWVARTHFDANPDGYSTAFQVLAALSSPATEDGTP